MPFPVVHHRAPRRMNTHAHVANHDKNRDCPREVQRTLIHQPLPRAAVEQRRSPRRHPASPCSDDVTTDHDVAHEGWANTNCAAHWILHCAVEPQIGTDAATHRVVALGGRVDIDPYDTELGRIARVSDPSGATFALIDPPDRVEQPPPSRPARPKYMILRRHETPSRHSLPELARPPTGLRCAMATTRQARAVPGGVALCEAGAGKIVDPGWSDHQGQLVEGSQDP
jgi:hypothetical protein